jgi:hypothetical protein
MGWSEERIARNDDAFRRANESIGSAAERYGVDHHVPFICECAEPRCTEIVSLALDEYQAVRADPIRFLTAPGHDRADGASARVVERHETYVVVEKVGRAAEVAEDLAEPAT